MTCPDRLSQCRWLFTITRLSLAMLFHDFFFLNLMKNLIFWEFWGEKAMGRWEELSIKSYYLSYGTPRWLCKVTSTNFSLHQWVSGSSTVLSHTRSLADLFVSEKPPSFFLKTITMNYHNLSFECGELTAFRKSPRIYSKLEQNKSKTVSKNP